MYFYNKEENGLKIHTSKVHVKFKCEECKSAFYSVEEIQRHGEAF